MKSSTTSTVVNDPLLINTSGLPVSFSLPMVELNQVSIPKSDDTPILISQHSVHKLPITKDGYRFIGLYAPWAPEVKANHKREALKRRNRRVIRLRDPSLKVVASKPVERCVRLSLSESITLDSRVYIRYTDGRREYFRELDGLCLANGICHIYEVKFTCSSDSIKTGLKQLRVSKALLVASGLFADVQAHLHYVNNEPLPIQTGSCSLTYHSTEEIGVIGAKYGVQLPTGWDDPAAHLLSAFGNLNLHLDREPILNNAMTLAFAKAGIDNLEFA